MSVTGKGWPALAIGIDPTVDRVGEEAIKAPVARTLALHFALGGMSGKLQAVLLEPQQSLTDAADLDDLIEQQLDGFANTPVRSLLKSRLFGLDIADRRTHDQLAAFGHLPACFEGSLAQ